MDLVLLSIVSFLFLHLPSRYPRSGGILRLSFDEQVGPLLRGFVVIVFLLKVGVPIVRRGPHFRRRPLVIVVNLFNDF